STESALGGDVATAVDRWVEGIADAGYNWKPDQYKATLRAFMNDYMTPGQTRSASHNLYQYSPPRAGTEALSGAARAEANAGEALAQADAPSAPALPPDAVERVKNQFAAAAHDARYMEQHCEPVTYPGWDGFALRQCRYTVKDKDRRSGATRT